MSWVQILNADYAWKWSIFPHFATPLYYAATFGLSGTVDSIIKTGVDLDAPGSRYGGTALHGAAYRQHPLAVKILLNAGADPNKADFNKVTPLHTAATLQNLEIVDMLLKHGAQIDALDNANESPLDWAQKSGHTKAHQMLLGITSNLDPNSNTPTSQTGIWRESNETIPYFPDFYAKRSGLEGSIILTVEIDGNDNTLTQLGT